MSDVKAGGSYIDVFVMTEKAERQLRDFSGKLSAFSGKLRSFGAPLVGIGVTAASGFGAAMKVFAGFEASIDALKAKLDGVSDVDFSRLEDKAKALGASTRFSASQVTEAMNFLAMAGMDVGEILEAIEPTLAAATAGQLDLAMAADIATDVTSAFGLSAAETGRVIDVLVKTATSANTTVELMGETFKYAAPLAAAAGQTIEDMAAAVGLLGSNGIKASVAGTDLAGILKTIPKEIEFFEGLGVSVANADGSIRSVIDILGELGAATKDLTEIERLQQFDAVFGRYAKSALILTSQTPQLAELKQAMDSAAGSAEKMAEVMGDNTVSKFNQVAAAAEAVGIAIGEVMAGAIGDGLEQLAAFLRKTAEFAEKNPGLVKAVAAFAAVIGAVGAACLTAAAAVGVMASAISGAVTIWGAASTVLTALGGSATAAGVGFSAMMGPLAALVGIGLAAWAIYQMGGIAELNEELQRSAKLAGELAQITNKRRERKLGELGDLQGGEKIHAINGEIEKAQRDEISRLNHINSLKKKIAGYSSFDRAVGNKLLELDKQDLAEAERMLDELQSYQKQLREMKKAATGTPRPGGSGRFSPELAEAQRAADAMRLQAERALARVPDVATIPTTSNATKPVPTAVESKLLEMMERQQREKPTAASLSPETATLGDVVRAVEGVGEQLESSAVVLVGEGGLG